MNKRYELIDLIRGFTVVLMIIFHFAFDLDAFRFVDINFTHDLFWWVFPRVIVFLFFIAVGMSLALVHSQGIRWRPFWQRFIKIAMFACIISAATYKFFPQGWIYFGTLHCIALASVGALPFLKRPWISLVVSAALLIPTLAGYEWPFYKLPHRSMDYIPLIPWFGVITLGIFLFHRGMHRIPIPSFPTKSLLLWLGKKALIVYLLHQAILYSLVYLVYKALSYFK